MNDAPHAERPVGTRWWVLFGGYGLRPFFLFGAVYAVIALGGWLHLLMGVRFWAAPVWLPGPVWHGHEMIFGYAGAVIAGFMLTAVPNWTNSGILKPGPLMVLFAVWLAGRIAMWNVDTLPPSVVAAIDLAFLPLLAVLAGGPVVMRRMYRNLVFVAILLFLTATNALIHLEALNDKLDLAATGVRLALDGVVLLIVIVGGRVVPAFTTNFLRQKLGEPGLRNPAILTKATILAMVAMIAADAVSPQSIATGVLSLAAGGLVLLRLFGWRGIRCLDESLIWILHAGYLWLGAGLLLKGASALSPDIPVTASVHALGAGAVGAMTLGVMARASLGHTGRVLTASFPLTLVFVLVNLGALFRVIAAWQPEMFGVSAYTISGATWSAAFVLFIVLFAPVLARPRIDGRPG